MDSVTAVVLMLIREGRCSHCFSVSTKLCYLLNAVTFFVLACPPSPPAVSVWASSVITVAWVPAIPGCALTLFSHSTRTLAPSQWRQTLPRGCKFTATAMEACNRWLSARCIGCGSCAGDFYFCFVGNIFYPFQYLKHIVLSQWTGIARIKVRVITNWHPFLESL